MRKPDSRERARRANLELVDAVSGTVAILGFLYSVVVSPDLVGLLFSTVGLATFVVSRVLRFTRSEKSGKKEEDHTDAQDKDQQDGTG